MMQLTIAATLVRCDVVVSPNLGRWDITNVPPAAVYYVFHAAPKYLNAYFLAWPITDQARLAMYTFDTTFHLSRYAPIMPPSPAVAPLFYPLPPAEEVRRVDITAIRLTFWLDSCRISFPRFMTPHSSEAWRECGGSASRRGVNLDSCYQHKSFATYLPPGGCPAWPGVLPGKHSVEIASSV